MATAAGFTTDPAAFGKYRADPVTDEQRVGPGAYLITGARSFAITNLGASGDVSIDGTAMPEAFSYSTDLLEPGSVYADVTVTVTAAEAFISTVT